MKKLADSFTVRRLKDDRAVGVMTHINDWSEPIMDGVIALGQAYAPTVLVMDASESDVNRYAIAGDIDLIWLKTAVERFEAGWELSEGRLASPDSSTISDRQMMELTLTALDVQRLDQVWNQVNTELTQRPLWPIWGALAGFGVGLVSSALLGGQITGFLAAMHF